jgi:hypothetical protein
MEGEKLSEKDLHLIKKLCLKIGMVCIFDCLCDNIKHNLKKTNDVFFILHEQQRFDRSLMVIYKTKPTAIEFYSEYNYKILLKLPQIFKKIQKFIKDLQC